MMLPCCLKTTRFYCSSAFNGSGSGGNSKKPPLSDQTRSLLNGTDADLKDVLAGNHKWKSRIQASDPTFFDRLKTGQTPNYLYIGCCDSRVDPTVMMSRKYGDLFIHRNVGNLVCGSDINALTALEFAVTRLNVPHLIVCGHYDCGAVRGALTQTDHGVIENWLRNIRDVQRLHHTELSQIPDLEKRNRRLVELNVIEQCLNILKTGCVQRKRMLSFKETGFAVPRVHALVFDPADGELKKLQVYWREETREYDGIYNLYPNDDDPKNKK